MGETAEMNVQELKQLIAFQHEAGLRMQAEITRLRSELAACEARIAEGGGGLHA